MYSEAEARQIAVEAAKLALQEFASPMTLSFAEAAERLKLSTRTIHRMNPPRVGGRIPYAWVMKQAEG